MRVLYFAWVREQIGMSEESVDPPEAVCTVADLAEWLKDRTPGHATALRDLTRLRAAVDQQFVPLDSTLGNAKEVAIFPPVTGG
ncbi:molybdopterin converting factor subunit 1 [Sphingomonas turrisvirgatae]|uniref:Molybdopterin synthase sulfur carrier subunit n=1 Tax=Sphingomonas turrisvirgatae TaxID=1888892 RepID=A0A1E3LR05_9SPHN|nr:molybdopterin converting factor subunit 1 [Sphingomonas turrisvirgatae]ODP36188.1 molybdopterin converting factor subunit 1 [Sphingomonas turrisvirgatae]